MTVQETPLTLDAAYRYCERLARTHYENFTVGSWLLPKEKRRHVHAVYAYCRTVDDLGDEAAASAAADLPPQADLPPKASAGGSLGQGEYRLNLLDWWQAELEACYSGTPTQPVMIALQETIQAFEIPRQPFLKLIEANRMDQRNQRQPTYDDLLHYCDHSANPVGHLFLYLFGYQDQERQTLSDATCTALQLTNFWQDLARDYQKGRIYLPLEDMARYGYSQSDLAQGIENDSFRQLMAFEVDRAMELFRRGAALAPMLEGTCRLDVALFTRGGVAVLDAIRAQDYMVLTARPSLSRLRKGGLFLSTWLSWKMGLGLGLPGSSHSGARQ
ncbi:MAG: squalene synthase HpnC [Chloroflexi bacterium]|nr:squalene synthase HpnC [Chloroflexota bacterium]